MKLRIFLTLILFSCLSFGRLDPYLILNENDINLEKRAIVGISNPTNVNLVSTFKWLCFESRFVEPVCGTETRIGYVDANDIDEIEYVDAFIVDDGDKGYIFSVNHELFANSCRQNLINYEMSLSASSSICFFAAYDPVTEDWSDDIKNIDVSDWETLQIKIGSQYF